MIFRAGAFVGAAIRSSIGITPTSFPPSSTAMSVMLSYF
jgi:hypothetical protein